MAGAGAAPLGPQRAAQLGEQAAGPFLGFVLDLAGP
jgi:hypothetical protein